MMEEGFQLVSRKRKAKKGFKNMGKNNHFKSVQGSKHGTICDDISLDELSRRITEKR